MIRLKMWYDDTPFNYDEFRKLQHYDNRSSFMDIVNRYNFNYDLYNLPEEPFRDEESMIFIEQIDNAKFTSKYGVATPYGECPVTSLCGGTQYALSVIYNSRQGLYTSYEPYGKDIWGRLEKLPMDILIFMDMDLIERYSDILNIEKFIFENYRDKNGNEYEKLIDNFHERWDIFLSVSFKTDRDFEKVVVEHAKNQIKHITIFETLPLIHNSFKELGDFIEYPSETREFEENEYTENPFLKYMDIKIYNYLTQLVSCSVKYPMIIVIERFKETKTYKVYEACSVKYPTFSELIMYTEYYKNTLDNYGEWDRMILTFDSGKDNYSKQWLKYIRLCEKLEGKTISFYNGERIWYEFLKFIDGYKKEN